MTVIFAVVALFTLATAFYAVAVKDRIVAVLSAGASGLFASILFIMMAAPDVAMTEAAIGSGLTTFIFFFALRKVNEGKVKEEKIKEGKVKEEKINREKVKGGQSNG